MSYRVPEKNDYYYDDSPNPIEEICKYTDNLENIPPEIRYRMLTAICRQKSSSVYGDYAAPPNKQIVDQINGQGGYFLKMTAEAAGIYLVWYQQAKGRYMFWGPTERSVRDAMNRLRGRIVKYVVHLDEPANRQAKEERAKVEKGKETPPKEMQGRTTKKREYASTGLEATATASSQKPADSSMKDPKGVGEVERETTLPWSLRKGALGRSKRRAQPKGGEQLPPW